ncbi:MAG: hypothetical protein JWN04_5829 [Myxococcaceae bacterium]|nr:hypothetical protein [Myxococcaceae bacterium]
MSRSDDGTSASGSPGATFAQRWLGQWRGSVAIAVVVSALLALRWLYFAADIYESHAIVEAQAQAQADIKPAPLDAVRAPELPERPLAPTLSASDPAAHDAATDPSSKPLELRVHKAIPELQEWAASGARPSGPGSARARQISPNQVVFVCRDDEPHKAQQHCSEVVSTALATLAPARMVIRPTLSAHALPPTPGASSSVLLGSLLIGLLGGAFWSVVRASRQLPARPLPEPASTGPISSVPPAPRSFSMLARSLPESGAALGPASDPSTLRDGGIIPIDMAGDWDVDPTESDEALTDKLTLLCEQLYLAAADGCMVVGVSSAPDDRAHKTRVAALLAWLLSRSGQARVLLVECDFDRPAVDRAMQLETPALAGFSQQMHARMRSAEALPWTVLRCTPTLSVLPEGRLRTPGMLYSTQFRPALAVLRKHYDIIVADGPAVGQPVESSAFESVVDGIVFASAATEPQVRALSKQWFRKKQLLAAISGT